jgi:hypothetical protein
MHTLANEGFRAAPTREEREYEAAKLFVEGKSGADHFKQATLMEAFGTDDFPILLGDAFSKQAVKAQQDAVKEFEPILTDVTVDDFNRHKLIDLWGNDAFETVKPGEEYKGGTLDESELTHGAAKHGKSYGLTWELRRSRQFSALANFPKLLGNGSVKGQNNSVGALLTQTNGWDTGFFGSVATAAFTPENLDAAIKALAVTEDHRGDLVDVSNLVLVYGPALRTEANRVLKAIELEMQVTDGTKVTKTRIANPFANVVTPLESRTIGKLLGTKPNGWALIQGKGSDLPSIIRTLLSGEETVDIRVKRDQGARPGGGDVPVDAGSFNDDTIWFRGRDVYGIDEGFTTGVYASNGA